MEVLAFLAFWILSAAWWWSDLVDSYVKADEVPYVAAASLVREGHSPYQDPWFFYTPSFAVAGAWLVENFGLQAYLRTLRALTLAGACLAAWCSLWWTGWPLWLRALLATAVLFFAETVQVGLVQGNVSALVVGLAIAALVLWRCHPVLAGLLLGLSIVIKPVALVMPLLLFLHRPSSGVKAHRVAAVVAAAFATGLLLIIGAAYLPDLVGKQINLSAHPRNLALPRLLYCFGILAHPGVLCAMALLVGAFSLRWRPVDEQELLCVAALASLMALPIVWIYTMLLALPIQFLATRTALIQSRKWRQRAKEAQARPRVDSTLLAIVLVGLAVVSIFLGHAAGAVDMWPLWLQGIVLAVPLLSLPFLVGYLLHFKNKLLLEDALPG